MDTDAREPVSNRDLARILSPLALWVLHIAYLVGFSPDPFLTRWLEGSFSFFLALVLCNVVRTRVVAAKGRDAGRSDPDVTPPDGAS